MPIVHATAAERAYAAAMVKYAERTERLVERLVLSKLPVVGSGDPLDGAALQAGLAELETALAELPAGYGRNARAAANRTQQWARAQAARALGARLPPRNRFLQNILADTFVVEQIRLLDKVGRDQVARIRQAIAGYEEGESMRQTILDALWVSRNRGKVIARTEVNRLFNETVLAWYSTQGLSQYRWVTAKDERVRHGHALLHGTIQDIDNPPEKHDGFGRGHCGTSPGCRCVAFPVR